MLHTCLNLESREMTKKTDCTFFKKRPRLEDYLNEKDNLHVTVSRAKALLMSLHRMMKSSLLVLVVGTILPAGVACGP